MKLYFVTGNKNKFEEVKKLLPMVEQLDIELPEIQSLSSNEVIRNKLEEAFRHLDGPLIVEDNSLSLKGMNGLPGPLIKWFLKSMGNEGLVKLSEVFGSEAEAKVVIGFAESLEGINYFEGVVKGKIVMPRGEKGFGWDAIFIPDGYEKTFAEMSLEEKNNVSMRRIAVEKLKDYLMK